MRLPFLLFLCVLLGVSVSGSSRLIFPLFSSDPQVLIGIAIVNPGDTTASVTFTAYGVNGEILAAEDSSTASAEETEDSEEQPQGAFTNPAVFEILPGQQFARVTSSIFGTGLDPDVAGWVEAASETDNLTGFFQVLDTSISFLDGADLPPLASHLIFEDVRLEQGFSTTVFVVNSDDNADLIELSLVSKQGVQSRYVQLAGKGVAEVDVAEFFDGVEVQGGRPLPAGAEAAEIYLAADSAVEVAGFEVVGKQGEDLLGLNARPADELLTTLLFPQLAVLGPFVTEAVVGNFGDEAAIVTMTAYRENGEIFSDEVQTNPVVRALGPGEVLRADLEATFGFSGETTLQGWLKVESTSKSINGSISYSLPGLGPIAAVSSLEKGSRRALFSHIGTSLGFFTGLATLNAGSLAANLRVVALKPDSEILGTFTTALQPGERRADLLADIIPEADGQAGGIVLVESDVPLYLTAIFGSTDPQNPVYANVPPQPVPDSFQPAMGIDRFEVAPPLAVLEPGRMQQFQLGQAGLGTAGATVWKVNGQAGGGAQTGTINGTGLYTAPAVIPTSLPVTITATADNQTAGASVDVQTRAVLVGGLGTVQSVAYLAGLDKLYTSELSFGTASVQGEISGGTEQSTIFEVTTGVQQLVAVFDDDIPKMIPYTAVNDKEYLLLAGRGSGSIRRMDPQLQTSQEVAGGLNAPNSLVIDPVGGDLLVAEADRVSVVPASQLNGGLAGAKVAKVEGRLGVRKLAAGLAPTGIAVDRCTGNVYVSQASMGDLLEIDRLTGETRVIAEGLSEPGQLLGFYRSGVSCPEAFHLLVLERLFFPKEEREASRITLLTPATGGMTLWLAEDSVVIPDLTLLPSGSGLGHEAVLLAENALGEGQLSSVQVVGRYDPEGINSPQIENCLGSVTIADPNLDSTVRGSLGIGPEDSITCQAALGVRILTATELGIASLEGLEDFSDLRRLVLPANQITDITPVAGLTQLRTLVLAANQIQDIGPLAGLTQLRVLNLMGNQLEDISPLAGLDQLQTLVLSINNISDITPVSNLKRLNFLNFQTNKISDISPLQNLFFLIHLFLGNNQVSDISPLQNLFLLDELVLNRNQISDISPLVANAGLDEGDSIRLDENNLDGEDCPNIQILINRGITVMTDVACP